MDMKSYLLPTNQTLDAFAQPALLVRQGQLISCNTAARALLPEPEAALPPALSRELTTDAGETQLELAGQLWNARFTDLDDGCLITLERAVAQLDAGLLAVLARTLRQPAASMFSVAGTLFPALEDLDDPKIQEQTAVLNHSFYQLLRLITNLTEADGYLSGQAVTYLARVELGEFMQDLQVNLKPLFETLGLELEVYGPKVLTTVYFDPGKLQRALLQLVSNAIKFSPPGGTVRLEAEANNAVVIFRCTDQGPGMDPGLVNDLNRLTQVQGGVGDPRWGLGLGLHLAWNAARLHGGTLMAEAPAQGGTRMVLTLNRIRKPAAGLLSAPPYDLTGGYNQNLIGLADVLPAGVFDSLDVN